METLQWLADNPSFSADSHNVKFLLPGDMPFPLGLGILDICQNYLILGIFYKYSYSSLLFFLILNLD